MAAGVRRLLVGPDGDGFTAKWVFDRSEEDILPGSKPRTMLVALNSVEAVLASEGACGLMPDVTLFSVVATVEVEDSGMM